MIAASLGAIPLRDRDAVQQVFRTFALVAEDTYVPAKAFCILLSAVAGAEPVGELQLRKWVQILINRSLVLGSWERPQLHGPCAHPSACSSFVRSLAPPPSDRHAAAADIVREYCISLHTPEELRRLQEAAVDAFATARPLSPQKGNSLLPPMPGAGAQQKGQEGGAGRGAAAFRGHQCCPHQRAGQESGQS